MASATLSEQIYRELYQDITAQRLKCGQKLTLTVLKDRFQVSHTPIREALMRLAENGLVTYRSNSSVVVTEFEEQDICQLFQFAAELDSMAITFCESNVNRMLLILDLQEIIETGSRLMEAGDLSAWKVYSEQVHTVFYRHARNSYLDEASRRLRAKIDVLSCMYYNEESIPKIHSDHIAICEAVGAGHFSEAARRMRQHLQYDMAYALKAYSSYQEAERAARK